MDSLAEIAEHRGAALLLQFGSTVSGQVHAASDVDIGVLYDRRPPSLLDQGALVEDLRQAFPGRTVDLAVLDRADPLFLKKVLENCRLLAGSPRRLAELRIYAFKRYQDHLPYLALERPYVDRVIAQAPAMIDRELVTRKMALIAEDLVSIQELARQPLVEYLQSSTSEVLAERYLERMIGRMIDVNYHLLTESGQPPPRDYFQSFVELAGLGVLEPDFARRIAACAGLRNRLVHEYDELDPAKVHEALGTAVADIPQYLDRVRRFVDVGSR